MTHEERVIRHVENLLRIFPDALSRNPVLLYGRLRMIEREGSRHAEKMCSDSDYYNSNIDRLDEISDKIVGKANALLGTDRVWLNTDPRGYALKVDLSDEELLHTDWGGYGIIAPDFSDYSIPRDWVGI